jgi:NAD(P)-dependent dehydrogenase (short-subunit alcohol dehydrogenase family)
MRIQDAVAIVTGGGSGLGAATARRLAAGGAKVVVVDRDAGRAEAVAAEIGGVPGAADVTSPESVSAVIAWAQALGPIRVAVSCAGVGWASRTLSRDGTPHDLEAFRTVLEINTVGTFNVMRLAAAAMAATEPLEDGERGVIVNTASLAAYDGQIGQVAYAAAKGAIVAMTLPAARDLAPAGIRVVTVAPGTFDTPMLAMLPGEQREALGSGIPFPRRLGHPDDFAALVEHIALNRYLNGEVIRLDGALRLPPR